MIVLAPLCVCWRLRGALSSGGLSHVLVHRVGHSAQHSWFNVSVTSSCDHVDCEKLPLDSVFRGDAEIPWGCFLDRKLMLDFLSRSSVYLICNCLSSPSYHVQFSLFRHTPDIPGNSCFIRNKIHPRKHIPYYILSRNTLTCISFHWVIKLSVVLEMRFISELF